MHKNKFSDLLSGLKEVRSITGLRQDQLSAQTGIHVGKLSEFENHQVSLRPEQRRKVRTVLLRTMRLRVRQLNRLLAQQKT